MPPTCVYSAGQCHLSWKYWSVCLSVCLCICLSVCLSVCVCLLVCLSVCLSACVFVFVFLAFCLSICLSVCIERLCVHCRLTSILTQDGSRIRPSLAQGMLFLSKNFFIFKCWQNSLRINFRECRKNTSGMESKQGLKFP